MTTLFDTYTKDQWNRPELADALNRFSKVRVLVVGDVGVDRYTQGTVERISPEAPVPIVKVDLEYLKLGMASNVADNIKALGGQAIMAGLIGTDRFGEDYLGLMKKASLSLEAIVQDPKVKTVLKERIVSDRQQLLRVDYEDENSVRPELRTELLNKIFAVLPSCDCVIFEDYGKGLFDGPFARKLIDQAKSLKKRILVDPNLRSNVNFYRGSDLLTPNKKEAESLTQVRIVDDQSLVEAGQKLLSLTEAKVALITLGKEGMAAFEVGKSKALKVPTFAKEVFDVSGAGDTVIATLALALSAGVILKDAILLANIAAGIEVGKRGTATVSPEEMKAAIQG